MLAVGRGLKPRSPGCCFTTVRVFILQLLDVVSVTKQITFWHRQGRLPLISKHTFIHVQHKTLWHSAEREDKASKPLELEGINPQQLSRILSFFQILVPWHRQLNLKAATPKLP